MIKFRVLLCFVLAIELGWADVPFDQVKLDVFDPQNSDFETNILKSLEVTKNFFTTDAGKAVFTAGAKAVSAIPFIAPLSALVPKVGDLLAEQSDWRVSFANAIAKESELGLLNHTISQVQASMRNIRDHIPLLSEKKQPDIAKRHTDASLILSSINEILHYFNDESGLFKKYPLLSSPLLIELVSIVALITPIANHLDPIKTTELQIPCKAYDLLQVYRSRSVYNRARKLNFEYLYAKYMMDVLTKPYNENGYTQTSPGTLRCDKGCEEPYPDGFCKSICKQFKGEIKCIYAQCEKKYELHKHSYCVLDEFGSNQYHHNDVLNGKEPTAAAEYPCISDYVGLVRQRVESMFPVEMLHQLCERRPREKTGYGWLTMRLGLVQAYGDAKGKSCDAAEVKECDAYVKLFINNDEVYRSKERYATDIHDLNHHFVSKRILRNSTIRIEIWDDDQFTGLGFLNLNDDLVLKSEDSIDSFLSNPFRPGIVTTGAQLNGQNSINTYALWEDEYRFTDEMRK